MAERVAVTIIDRIKPADLPIVVKHPNSKAGRRAEGRCDDIVEPEANELASDEGSQALDDDEKPDRRPRECV